MIRIDKINGNTWIIHDTKTGKAVDIIGFEDYTIEKVKTRYRVDHRGRTMKSMIDTLAEAKRIARGVLREV